MDRDFDAILLKIQHSGEQRSLENRDVSARLKAFGIALIFGLLVLCATAAAFSNLSGWIAATLGIMALLAVGAWDRAMVQSIIVAKEQDRRYFLACLRNARSIDELKRAGLFAYLPEEGGPEWVVQVKADVVALQGALKVEPDWFQVS
jgi:hypothetical protein